MVGLAHHAELTERFDDALDLAVELHRDQRRKGGGVPYVAHLLGVAATVLEYGGGEDHAIAALLHDAAEDQGGRATLDRIRSRFGDVTADIVAACSDTLESPKPSWRARKQAYIEELRGASDDVRLVALADKLYNARAIRRDYRRVGEDVWDRFRADRGGTLWYYGALVDAFRAGEPSQLSLLVEEFEAVVEAIDPAI